MGMGRFVAKTALVSFTGFGAYGAIKRGSEFMSIGLEQAERRSNGDKAGTVIAWTSAGALLGAAENTVLLPFIAVERAVEKHHDQKWAREEQLRRRENSEFHSKY